MIQIPNKNIRHFHTASNILQRECTVALAEIGIIFVKLNQLRIQTVNLSPLYARNKSADRLLDAQPIQFVFDIPQRGLRPQCTEMSVTRRIGQSEQVVAVARIQQQHSHGEKSVFVQICRFAVQTEFVRMMEYIIESYKKRKRIIERQVHQLACREKSMQLIQHKAYPSVLFVLGNIVIYGRSPFELRPFLFV